CPATGRCEPIRAKYSPTRPAIASSIAKLIRARCIRSTRMESAIDTAADEWTHTVGNKRHPVTRRARWIGAAQAEDPAVVLGWAVHWPYVTSEARCSSTTSG